MPNVSVASQMPSCNKCMTHPNTVVSKPGLQLYLCLYKWAACVNTLPLQTMPWDHFSESFQQSYVWETGNNAKRRDDENRRQCHHTSMTGERGSRLREGLNFNAGARANQIPWCQEICWRSQESATTWPVAFIITSNETSSAESPGVLSCTWVCIHPGKNQA